ncbi:uncharacterized protein LOC104123768 [Egretta garzetta]|nr:uncharacterized protein LOC104123768 [Egretta garzetta]
MGRGRGRHPQRCLMLEIPPESGKVQPGGPVGNQSRVREALLPRGCGPPCLTAAAIFVWQEPVTFEDVAVYLSRTEWDAIAEGQKELYRSVMLDNYTLLTSLGYPGPKPDILYRLERGEAPWVCTPQSPVRWDGPDSPSLGHDGDMSWWPGAGGCQVLEERAQAPCQGGRCLQWRLRSRRLLNKCLGGGSQLPSQAGGEGVGPVESQDQAQTIFWPGKDGAVEDKLVVTANLTQCRGFPLHPVTEEQNKKADPQERLSGEPREGERERERSTPGGQHPLGEVTVRQGDREPPAEDTNETVLKDHCYCVTSETRLWHCTPHLCLLREHDYCRDRRAGVSALKDHEYCDAQQNCHQGRADKVGHLTGTARAVLHRLTKQRSQIRRIIRRAKRMMWHHKPGANKSLGSSSTSCLPEPAAPPAEPEGDTTKGTRGAFCPPAEQEAVPPQPQSEGGSRGGVSEVLHAPVVSFELVAAHPPSNPATRARCFPLHLKASIHGEAQSPDAQRNVEGRKPVYSTVLLCDAYKMVLRTVDHVLDSINHNLERGGFSQRKDLWPPSVRIDS